MALRVVDGPAFIWKSNLRPSGPMVSLKWHAWSASLEQVDQFAVVRCGQDDVERCVAAGFHERGQDRSAGTHPLDGVGAAKQLVEEER